MDCKEWLKLFGRQGDDKQVKAALAKVGVKKIPPIEKDESDTSVDLEDMILIFSDAELFPSRNTEGDGSVILSGITLPLNDPKMGRYKGELPFQLDTANSQKQLRARFGKPLESHARFCWDQWEIDKLIVTITYTKDLGSLVSVVIQLPDED